MALVPMRIALVSREYPPATNPGGIGTYTHKTARALARLGQEVHVFTEADRGSSPDDSGAVTLHRLAAASARPDERRAVLRAWAVARALWSAGPFDVVQACEWDAEAFVYALHPRSPLITRLATPTYLVNRLNRASSRRRLRSATLGRLERLQTRLSTRVISPSRCLADVVARDWAMAGERITVVPTGIEIPTLATTAPGHGLAGRRYLMYFGRLEARKGVRTLIDALGHVLEQDQDLWAVLAGRDLGLDGKSFAEYAAERLGPLMGRVRFLPALAQSELFPLVAGAQLVVLPSTWESLANACLEAMALGRPVVATTGSGFAEVIHDGVDGFLVPPENERRLAAAVLAALADPGRLAAVGQAARLRAGDYDLTTMASRLLALYEEVKRGPAVRRAVEATRSAES